MKTYILLLALSVLLFTERTNAQTNKAHKKIEKSLNEAFVYNGGIFEAEEYRNLGFTFGLAVCINGNGRVDSVIYSNRTPLLEKLVLFNRITTLLKNDKATFINHKNSVLVSLVLLRRSWDNSIANFADKNQQKWNPERTNFDDYFYQAMPQLGIFGEKRKVVLLPTFSMVQSKSIR